MVKSNYSLGHDAEQRVAEWLQTIGYGILDMNWRTKQCEIDIIAQKTTGKFKKSKVIYFIEVKSRSNSSQGDGFEYITASKLKQMEFAAQMWLADHDWQGESQMAAVAVLGSQFELVKIL
jgi:Holliday junction resolvase-like predicted endonuclease